MEILNKRNPVRRDIEKYFQFLFDKGFKFRYSDFAGRGMLIWNIVLESPKCLIHIYQEKSDVFLAFAPLNAMDENNEISVTDEVALEPMIYYITKYENFIGLFDKETYASRKKLFQRLADLLKQYIDEITPYFENFKFRQYQRELLATQHDYNDLLVKRYVRGGKTSPF